MFTLKNVLKINAVSSGATGLLLVIFSGLVAELFTITFEGVISEVGIFLILFAAFVFIQGTKNSISAKGVSLIILMDVLWVVASLFIVVFQLFDLSMIGYIAISAVAGWVAIMALLQWNGLKKLRS